MKKLVFLAVSTLLFASLSAQAQNMRVRGTITSLDGDVLSVKTREGKDVKVQLASDAQVATTKKVSADEFKAGSYVGVTSVKGPDGRLLAKRVHALGPQVPQMHGAWDGIPNSMMTNSNITSITKAGKGNELTLTNKEGEQKILVDGDTEYYNFVPGTRADLKAGETIFTGARVEGDKILAQRVTVSKDGVKPPQ
ncbi:MAG TPA: DUF5666 domain-containing protein [Burkholderiales bacterium]|nr:DUF5666 domain-containing protein [Burkholderiales bacterium]